ncbi:MAG TPA: hypothetical protein DCY13_04505 [Verrucomicrobiales bacterium]|nr:hypothetical protein [Verrucomicrobiales bacterium]
MAFLAVLAGSLGGIAPGQEDAAAAERTFAHDIQPLVQRYCLDCHSTERQKGDLDLERFKNLDTVTRHSAVWEKVVEQVELGEMPPDDEPQPSAAERTQLLNAVQAVLRHIALTRAGDPGPVVLRRLNNAEYTYTIRDLTGVAALDPAREFPTDSAAGEGFMNVGQALVMSPALVTKYLDAAKEIAAHAVLLPDGIAFSPSTWRRDWTEERLAAIREFYGRFTEPGGGTAVNLQGIKFDTKDGGVLPLEKYLAATIELRSAPGSLRQLAAAHGLNPKYLATLWEALNATNRSLLLDPIRVHWHKAQPDEAATLADAIRQWQQALWRFTTVGHIGKRDGPKAWQLPVTPLAEAREVRLKLPPATSGKDVSFFLATSDAGDGDEHDVAVWENPRLIAAGRPDLPLREVRPVVANLNTHLDVILSSAARCLMAAAEVTGALDAGSLEALARKHDVPPVALSAWLQCLGLGAGETRIEGHITGRMESAQGYAFIKGWTGADALSVVANSSDSHVRIPGNMKPRSVAVHPSPSRRVVIGWRAPLATTLELAGVVQHAHPECGNGVAWAIEVRRGGSRQRLAAGTAQGAREAKFGPLENLAVRPGDVVAMIVSPRDGNHSCDLTAVDLTLSDGSRTWSLAKGVAPDILAGNPHADGLGNPGVWHFFSEPDKGGSEPGLPAGSLLAKWQSSSDAAERRALAEGVQKLLNDGPAGLAKDAPDAVLHRQLTSLTGPLLSSLLAKGAGEFAQTSPADAGDGEGFGLDPGQFTGGDLVVRPASLIKVRLPADLAEGCEFVATARLHEALGREGSVQMRALATKPASLGLAAGVARLQGGKSTWSDGERPVISEAPILVTDAGAAIRRIEAAFDEFRRLFPAALCYTKIVPVDEVVTLTLHFREDDHLRRLMLDDAQAAELDRLWDELHYVSHDALKLVDAFEQLWQYATQDADPSAFEPLREPIKQRAAAFRQRLLDTQPAHLDAVLKFAEGAYRRPLTAEEQDELRGLYAKLRDEEIGHDDAIRLTLARTLVAPAFLYKLEQPPPGDQPGPVNDWELATRLSYFLWSSAPDVELRAVAAGGNLQNPDMLVAQTRRLLQDPRVRRLATEFACAWLHIYDFDELGEKSERHFPTFNDLRGAMYEETIRFFTDLFQNDGSVLDILDADYAFLNAELAKHYGVPDSLLRSSGRKSDQTNAGDGQSRLTSADTSRDDDWQRVDGLKQLGRGGILAHATTLAKQSGASRTSPILRGNWISEVLLGEKLPRPPANVPQLPEDEATETLTVRELTEKHSSDPRCFGCHRRIDPYGFALEAFDAIGRRREQDLGGRPIDTRTRVMDGTELAGLNGLRDYLLNQRRDAFVKQFCRKLLGYALGRGVLLSDGPLIDEMGEQLRQNEYRIGAAIETIVRSRQFREIRGKEMAFEQ